MSSSDSRLDHVTPYDRFAWSDTQIEAWLARGEHAAELGAYFGPGEYRDLVRLARRALRTPPVPDPPRVFVVPGIMGSQLGVARAVPLPNDILWLDPIDIQLGRLGLLRLPGGAPIVPLGAVLYSYLRLKLQLRAHGFAPEFHDYDWRLSVTELGQAFAERLREASGRVAIVAHSMGGLVTRAALALAGTAHVERVVLLGTPNSGSFAAVQALRGTYAVVRKLARLTRDSAETLAGEIFNTFPSLYDLLPADGRIDLLDAAAWPVQGPRPLPELLARARASRRQLAPSDARFAVIIGVGEETVTHVARRRGEFVYTVTRHGDGTVPATSAMLPGAVSAYARVAHSDLTRDPVVAAAVIDFLRHGATRRLAARSANAGRARAQVSDRALRALHAQKVDWSALEPDARREFLQNLNEPPRFRLTVPRPRSRRR